MILRYILIGIAIIAVLLGIRQLTRSTMDLIEYNKESANIYEHFRRSDIVILNQDHLTFGAGSHPDVFLVTISGKKIAIINMPKGEEIILVKRSPKYDSMVQQHFRLSETVNVFEAINNIFLYFLKEYIISLFLILFAVVFYIASRAAKREEAKDTSIKLGKEA